MRAALLLTLTLFALAGPAKGDTTITAQDANTGRPRTSYETTDKTPISDIRLLNGATFNNVTPINKYLFFYSADSLEHKKTGISNWEEVNYMPVALVCDIGVPGSISASIKTIEIAATFNPHLTVYSEAHLNTNCVLNIKDSASSGNRRTDNYRMETDLNRNGLVNPPDYADFISGNFDPVPAAAVNPLLMQIFSNNDYLTTTSISLNSATGDNVSEGASFEATNPPKQTDTTIP